MELRRRALAVLTLALPALSACASPAFTVPARSYLEDYRRDFGPGPAELQAGGITELYLYPAAVTDARCRRVDGAERTSCRFSYSYDERRWHAMEGTFERGADHAWRYVADSAERVER